MGLSTYSLAELERLRCAEEDRRLAENGDREAFKAFAIVSLLQLAASAFWRTESRQLSLLQPLCALLFWGLPWLLQRQRREAHARHRTLVVTAVRLACLALPFASLGLAQVYAPAQLSASPASLVVALAQGARLPFSWALALGLRTRFRWHCGLQALLAAGVVFVQAPALCRTAYVQRLAQLYDLHAAGAHLTRWVGFLLPSGPAPAGEEGRSVQDLSPAQLCLALLVATHLTFGLLLPSLAVLILEGKARAEHMKAVVASAPPGWGPQRVAQHLGLPLQALLNYCTFDPAAAWLQCAAFLPPLAAVAWLGALWFAELWGPLSPLAATRPLAAAAG